MGWKDETEKQALIELIKESDLLGKAEIDFSTWEDTQKGKQVQLYFNLDDGWRGGGATCRELILEVFSEFCKSHPHIDVEVTAYYVEHAPYDVISIKGEDVSESSG